MNKKLIIMLLALMLLASPMVGVAAPVTVTVNYVITSTTGFHVSNLGVMTFEGTREATNVNATGQDADNPWATITNDGNVNQSFNVKLNSDNPSSIVLKIANSYDMIGAITASATPATPVGWEKVAPEISVDLFAKASFNGAPEGTTPRTLTINSSVPIATGGGGGGGGCDPADPDCY